MISVNFEESSVTNLKDKIRDLLIMAGVMPGGIEFHTDHLFQQIVGSVPEDLLKGSFDQYKVENDTKYMKIAKEIIASINFYIQDNRGFSE